MGEVLLIINEELETSNGGLWKYCRICHEAEFESCKSLEVPCSCSGTVKFAHRDCIQKWCDEKGNTVCEICLQNYEPGYTATSKKSQLQEAMTARDSLEVPREGEDNEESDMVADSSMETRYSECVSDTDTTMSRCRSFALTFTFLLLLKNLFDSIAGGTEDYPFTLFTILLLRATGVILPMYVLYWMIATARRRILQHSQDTGYYDATWNCSEDEEQRDLV